MHALAKIIAEHAGKSGVEVGEIVTVEPDCLMCHDRGIAKVIRRFEEMGGKQVWNPDKVVVVFDHVYPPPRIQDAESQAKSREWMKAHGIKHFYPGDGVCHIVIPEKGFAYPGSLAVGSDSHTVTYSALGCFATGMGHTDLGSTMCLGTTWLRVPETVRVDVHGTPKPWTEAKDILLKLLGEYGEAMCTYQAVEYAGPTVETMAMDHRLTMCNLAIEIGAKSGYIAPDEITWKYMEGRRDKALCSPQTTDSDQDYAAIYDVNVEGLEPLVALPHDLSKVEPASQLAGVKIDEAVLGTCTGGRLEDFRAAAAVLKGRKLHPDTRMIVNPGSTEIYLAAMKEGLIQTMVEAGADIGSTGCGPCSGCQLGMLAKGETSITSSSRNYLGRMGSPESSIYVASAATVAASAVAGQIAPADAVVN
jgi:3-isopropylmalate dehydratase large subunit